MPRSPSRCAIDSRNGCHIPAPAPCASTYTRRASGGRTTSAETSPIVSSTLKRSSVGGGMLLVEAALQPGQRGHQVGLLIEHRRGRFVFGLLHPRGEGGDGDRGDARLGGAPPPLER